MNRLTPNAFSQKKIYDKDVNLTFIKISLILAKEIHPHAFINEQRENRVSIKYLF